MNTNEKQPLLGDEEFEVQDSNTGVFHYILFY